MSLASETVLANDQTFQARIRAATIRTAIAVIEDAQEQDATRLALARQALQQPDSVAIRVSQIAAALGATEAITDESLLSALADRWSSIARLLVGLCLLLVLGAPVAAQVRLLPSAADARPWVEVAEPGAAGDVQVLALEGLARYDSPYTGAVARAPKAEADLLFYDSRSGFAFVVRSQRGPSTTPFLFECFESAWFRPGLTWTVADLDGDGRSDLIAHDATRAEVVRLFQRGEVCR